MDEFSFETLTINEHGQVVERRPGTARQFSEELGGGVPLEMVAIPGGMFQMGSAGHTGYPDERPQHLVSVSPFLLGKAEVTQEQWQAVMGNNLPFRFVGPKLPVERACWTDGVAFCARLSEKTGRAYRLPSEAEWEYACRAGTAGPFYFGPTLTTDLANYVGEHTYAAEPKGIYRHTTTPAGSFPPNAFGLYDMHGSLWEWCADAWHEDYSGAPPDGSAWVERGAHFRVVRGGSWHETPAHCRSAVRLKFAQNERDDFVGFRVALTPDG
jgi:formylglycine-generating enzyme required for sulfatase activity